jgi:hypothetical protein
MPQFAVSLAHNPWRYRYQCCGQVRAHPEVELPESGFPYSVVFTSVRQLLQMSSIAGSLSGSFPSEHQPALLATSLDDSHKQMLIRSSTQLSRLQRTGSAKLDLQEAILSPKSVSVSRFGTLTRAFDEPVPQGRGANTAYG